MENVEKIKEKKEDQKNQGHDQGLQAKLLDGGKDREPSRLAWNAGRDQAEQGNKNNNEMPKWVVKDMRENPTYQKNSKDTEAEDIGAWDAEDNGTDEEDGKVDKGSSDTWKGKCAENAVLISGTEDEEQSEQGECYKEGTRKEVKESKEKKDDKPEDGNTTEEEIEVEMTDTSSDEG